MLVDFKVAAVQMVSGEDTEQNLKRATYWVEQAAGQGAQLVALPEYFPLLHHDETVKFSIAEDYGHGPIQQHLSALAKRLNIWLVAGSIPLKSKQVDHVTNTTLVFDPAGECMARYDKIHLFSFQQGEESYNESSSIEAGLQPVCFDTPWGRVGLAICYDLRFPELFRALDNVDLLIVPSAFTVPTGRAHWELLLKARAVENQCYLLAPAQGGEHESGRQTWGHTMAVDPWGEVLAVQEQGEGVISATLNVHRIEEVRRQLPAWLHRRL
ncbi:carbon-nitrogen hydrolase family protein [Oceanospirillum maris]|uniref:carbon-nitrogen hydrolase family protein n=1 Tax=Oceanospirillum maris TaxID=64977 RepID=UPI00042686E3|nr:carbon-nitrogen hydrolase family protein [Oceanospirillum maris]